MAGAGFIVGIFGLVFYLFILLLPIALLVALQVWLCRKGRRLGLILPVLSLALSLMLVFSLAAFSRAHGGVISGGRNRISDENGQPIPVETVPAKMDPATIGVVAGVFLVTNIPTVVFGGIWLHYKGGRETYEDLKRMRIEDLE